VSVVFLAVRLYLTVPLYPIDNKLSLVLRSFLLMSSRDQDKFSIPSVWPGVLSFLWPYSHRGYTGFEYVANPKLRSDGYIIWDMDNKPTVRMGAGAVGPDQRPDGSGVDQRLISEEPMVCSCRSFTVPLLILAMFSP